MIPITQEQRRFANDQIDLAAKALRDLIEIGRNLDSETRDAINDARESISLAETLLANQPHVPAAE